MACEDEIQRLLRGVSIWLCDVMLREAVPMPFERFDHAKHDVCVIHADPQWGVTVAIALLNLAVHTGTLAADVGGGKKRVCAKV